MTSNLPDSAAGGTTPRGARWLLALPLALFVALTAGLTWAAFVKCGAHFAYPLDDTYIHLAMARNLAHHGVWGITPYEFSSTSSSLLWTLLLAGVTLAWPAPEAAPLLLNVLCGLGLLWCLGVVVARLTGHHWLGALAGLATVLLVPLPVIALNGMEHLLHAWLTVALLGLGVAELTGQVTDPRRVRWLGVLSMLLVMSRFEGLFLIACLALLLAVRRRLGPAALVLAMGVLPVAVFGAISVHYGSMILPNSVLLKGAAPHGSLLTYLRHLLYQERIQLRSLHHVSAIMGAALVLLAVAWRARERLWSEGVLLLGFTLALLAAHLAFAAPGVRYEAYLAVVGVFGLTVGGARLFAGATRLLRVLTLAAGLLAMAPWVPRAYALAHDLPTCSVNIYQQQYQMGLFLRQYYQGATVVANDIGAINYLADLHCLDWWGLGTIEVARARLAKRYTSELLEQMARARGGQIAVVYDDWLKDYVKSVPKSWLPVARWTIRDNIICAYPTVTFHALDPREAPRLRQCVRQFALPSAVEREFIAAEPTTPPASH